MIKLLGAVKSKAKDKRARRKRRLAEDRNDTTPGQPPSQRPRTAAEQDGVEEPDFLLEVVEPGWRHAAVHDRDAPARHAHHIANARAWENIEDSVPNEAQPERMSASGGLFNAALTETQARATREKDPRHPRVDRQPIAQSRVSYAEEEESWRQSIAPEGDEVEVGEDGTAEATNLQEESSGRGWIEDTDKELYAG